jgi:hypothetical protein
MTAAAILKRYRRIAPVIGHKSSAWIVMLTICEAGAEGIDHSDLGQLMRGKPMALAPTLRRWKEAGILVSGVAPARGVNGGRPRVIYMATSKLYRALGIDPAEKAIGPQK